MAGSSMTRLEIWQAALTCCRTVLKGGRDAGDVAAIGITNQRETSLLVWDKARPASRCTMPSSGRTGAARRAAPRP